MKQNIVLGISESHNSTATLLVDGKIVFVISEERLSRKKNQWGFPAKSVGYILDHYSIKPEDIDQVVLSFKNPFIPLHEESAGKNEYWLHALARVAGPLIKDSMDTIGYYVPPLYNLYKLCYDKIYKKILWKMMRLRHFEEIERMTGIRAENITAIDHHLAHACSVLYSFNSPSPKLIFVADGIGDDSCATLYTASDLHDLSVVASTPNGISLAYLYGIITGYLGMKKWEHEYKVMGLAPYADTEGVARTYEILKKIIWLDDNDLSFKSHTHAEFYHYYLKKHLEGHRFDWIAGAAQKLVEDLLSQWVSAAIKKTQIHTVLLAGGIFMNIKANQVLSEIAGVENMYIMPSGADESTAIGAAYYGYHQECTKRKGARAPLPIENLYLGNSYPDSEVLQAIEKYPTKFSVKRIDDIEKEIARLLTEDKIIGRFNGRMEFGARALGNRSILANPSNRDLVQIINEKIKQRDFWMPFACTVLKEREKDYLINPNNFESPYMMLGYRTTDLGKKCLRAAIHPYDKTVRPQILTEEMNPAYYRLIRHFEEITGIGAVLNTSFNLHGEPIVCSPFDALRTFELSDLDFLALGNYLLSK